jgi:hypothetical protein
MESLDSGQFKCSKCGAKDVRAYFPGETDDIAMFLAGIRSGRCGRRFDHGALEGMNDRTFFFLILILIAIGCLVMVWLGW